MKIESREQFEKLQSGTSLLLGSDKAMLMASGPVMRSILIQDQMFVVKRYDEVTVLSNQ
jgi:hypothetical protein